MLTGLRIENIAVIEKADINFDKGFNVLTGETGAGKSIIIDAINAILGERTSKELIRTGEDKAKVTASFCDINEYVKSRLASLEIPEESDGTLIVQRVINADGRNTCRVNGCPVTVSMLKDLGSALIDIHGQHDSRFLLSADNHCAYIDKLADNEDILYDYEKVFRKYVSIKKEIKSLETDEEEKARTIELLQFQIDELENASIRVGETEELNNLRKKLTNCEKIMSALQTGRTLLNGDDDTPGIIQNLKFLSDTVSGVEDDFSEIKGCTESVNDSMFALEDCEDLLRKAMSNLEFDPALLEETEERLSFLNKLSLKYGSTETEMIANLEAFKKQQQSIVLSDEKIEELTEELEQTGTEMLDLAEELTQSRITAAEEFVNKVSKELEFLNMPGVVLTVSRKDKPLGVKGKDSIEFFISANVGEAPKPLAKIASGGELSRIMLAIKNVISEKDEIDTMIFDEIDTGVSGHAATKIAQKLSQLSLNRQVICVTHLAQIAAYADEHIFIEKSASQQHTFTSVRNLSNEGRKFELSRIIGGSVITQSQLKTAEEMMKDANTFKGSR